MENFDFNISIGSFTLKIDRLTKVTLRFFIGDYCVTYNKETDKLRVARKGEEIFNSEL